MMPVLLYLANKSISIHICYIWIDLWDFCPKGTSSVLEKLDSCESLGILSHAVSEFLYLAENGDGLGD